MAGEGRRPETALSRALRTSRVGACTWIVTIGAGRRFYVPSDVRNQAQWLPTQSGEDPPQGDEANHSVWASLGEIEGQILIYRPGTEPFGDWLPDLRGTEEEPIATGLDTAIWTVRIQYVTKKTSKPAYELTFPAKSATQRFIPRKMGGEEELAYFHVPSNDFIEVWLAAAWRARCRRLIHG